jgi:hypothetical protein
MKFSIEKAVLAKAVAQAQSVVERRNTIPILANVLMEAKATACASAPPTSTWRWWTARAPAWISPAASPSLRSCSTRSSASSATARW